MIIKSPEFEPGKEPLKSTSVKNKVEAHQEQEDTASFNKLLKQVGKGKNDLLQSIVKTGPNNYKVDETAAREKEITLVGLEEKQEATKTTQKDIEVDPELKEDKQKKPVSKQLLESIILQNLRLGEYRNILINSSETIKNILQRLIVEVEKGEWNKKYLFKFVKQLPLEISIEKSEGSLKIIIYAKGELKADLANNLDSLYAYLRTSVEDENIELQVLDLPGENASNGEGAADEEKGNNSRDQEGEKNQ